MRVPGTGSGSGSGHKGGGSRGNDCESCPRVLDLEDQLEKAETSLAAYKIELSLALGVSLEEGTAFDESDGILLAHALWRAAEASAMPDHVHPKTDKEAFIRLLAERGALLFSQDMVKFVQQSTAERDARLKKANGLADELAAKGHPDCASRLRDALG